MVRPLPVALLALLAICVAPVQASPTFRVGDLPKVRCVSNYLYGEQCRDPRAWREDLRRMKTVGLNAVWMVNVWAEYQPSTNPVRWQTDRIRRMQQVCSMARSEGMWVVLPLAYVGEGWAPKGVDAAVWPLDPASRLQHIGFLARMAAATRKFGNVVYLLCSEEILPATLLYSPDKRPECVQSFRTWARQANPDIGYWNDRWGTNYTWETLAPADTSHRPRWQLWADHARWQGWLMRSLLPPMVAAIRKAHPGAIIGFHDFLMPRGMDLTAADGALVRPSLVDFYSFGCYYDHSLAGGFEANVRELTDRVDVAQRLYPGLPLFCGELGLDVALRPTSARAEGESLQARFLRSATALLSQRKVGFSLWSWRTSVPDQARTHSLLREDGTATPALEALASAFTKPN